MQTVVDNGTASRRHALAFAGRALDYCFGLLYGILLIRLVLEFLDARKTAGFYRFIRAVTDPFYGPFQAIVGTDSVGGARIVWSLVVAIFAYMLLHAGLRGLLHLASRR